MSAVSPSGFPRTSDSGLIHNRLKREQRSVLRAPFGARVARASSLSRDGIVAGVRAGRFYVTETSSVALVITAAPEDDIRADIV